MELEKKLKESEESLTGATAEINQLKKQIGERDLVLVKSQNRNIKLDEKIHEQEKEFAEFKAVKESIKEALEKTEKEKKEKEKVCEEMGKAIQEKDGVIEKLRKEIEELKSKGAKETDKKRILVFPNERPLEIGSESIEDCIEVLDHQTRSHIFFVDSRTYDPSSSRSTQESGETPCFLPLAKKPKGVSFKLRENPRVPEAQTPARPEKKASSLISASFLENLPLRKNMLKVEEEKVHTFLESAERFTSFEEKPTLKVQKEEGFVPKEKFSFSMLRKRTQGGKDLEHLTRLTVKLPMKFLIS